MNIGITGATGFIGSYLINYLKNKEYKLCGFSRKAFSSDDNDNLSWFIGDLASSYDCEKFVEKVDVIIHLAHTNTPISSDKDVVSDASLNLLPTLNLLEAIKNANKKVHIIYPGSGGAVYGASKDKIPFKESDLTSPTSSYGIQKLVAEHYLRLWSEKGYITSTVLRISNPYGIILPTNRKQGLIGVVLNRIIHNQPVEIYGNPNNMRDYVHLDDLCFAFEKCLISNKNFDIFNIGSGKSHSVNEILSIIERESGFAIQRDYKTYCDSNNLVDWVGLDITKAKNELQWQPEIDLESGLSKLCKDLAGNTHAKF
jgi:UDP-glucose 4-epimerase